MKTTFSTAKKTFLVSIFAALCLGILGWQLLQAHGRTEVGEYAILVGWRAEPPIVGERNALIFEITQDEQPLMGLEGSLNMEVHYGGRTFLGDLKPTAKDGWYETEIFPTVKGQYEVRLFGEISGVTIDVLLEPEEVQSGAVLQFPEEQPQLRDLQAQIDALQNQLALSRWLGLGGLVSGLAGIVSGFWAGRHKQAR